jgi:hypothetical protein
MTTKTTIMFALAAILIAPAVIGMSYAEPQSNAEMVASYDKAFLTLETEKRGIDEKLSATPDNQALKDRSAQIQEQLDAIADKVEQLIQNNKAKYYIEPTLEQKLMYAQDILDASEGIGWTQSYPDGTTDTLKVTVQSKEDVQKVIELLPDVPLTITIGEGMSFTGCDGTTSVCDPIMGRLQMQGSGDGLCTISVPYTRGTTQGFLTAGHCVDASTFVYQPTQASGNKIGTIFPSDWKVSGSCDCAFVTKTGTLGIQSRIYDSGTGTSYTWYSITDYTTMGAGDIVSVAKKSGSIVHGAEVLAVGVSNKEPNTGITITNLAKINVGSSSGDSGGAIFTPTSHRFHGIISAGSSTELVASNWFWIKSALGL